MVHKHLIIEYLCIIHRYILSTNPFPFMSSFEPLDAPQSPLETPKEYRWRIAHKIFFGLELLLWLIILMGLCLKLEQWEGGSEALIIGCTLLMLAYLLFPIFIFGSQNIRRHLASHAVGFVTMLGIAAFLFRLESWEGALEMALVAFMPSLIAIIIVAILILTKSSRWRDGHFYKHLLVRLLLIALLVYGPVFKLFAEWAK
jgi:hypothetical protein